MYNPQLTVDRIKEVRELRGISLAELNEYCGLNRNTIAVSANSKTGLSAKILSNVSEILGCSADYLLGKTDNFNVLSSNSNGSDNTEKNSFGSRLKELRLRKQITQEQLATYLGVSKSAVGMWEGEKREPDLETVLKVADYFEVSVEYLLGRENQTVNNSGLIMNGNNSNFNDNNVSIGNSANGQIIDQFIELFNKLSIEDKIATMNFVLEKSRNSE